MVLPISVRTGPTIERVVSPRASRSTIQRALDSRAIRGDFGSVLRPPRPSALPQPAAPVRTGGGAGRGKGLAPASPGSGGGAGPAPGAEETEDTLAGLSAEALEDAIAALEAQYGLTLEEIVALGGDIGARAALLRNELERRAVLAQEQLISNLLNRGLFRSGIAARDLGRLREDIASERAQFEQDVSSRLRELQRRAGMGAADLERQKADIRRQIEAGNLDAEVAQALLGELESITIDDIRKASQANKGR